MAYRKSTREASQCRTSPADPVDGLAAQTLDLRAAGAEKVFREQATSIGPREALKRCQDYLRKGDALVVATPDRLAHSVGELLKILRCVSSRYFSGILKNYSNLKTAERSTDRHLYRICASERGENKDTAALPLLKRY